MIAIRRNFWVVIILLLVSIAAAIITGTTIYYRLVYLWGLLIITGWIWTYFSVRGIALKRQARTLRQQVGQIFEERFEITNQSRLPHLWISIKDEGSIPGSAGSRVLSWIGGRQQRTYLSYTWLTKRGQFSLGPTVFESGDLFGLFSARSTVLPQSSLLVTPFFVDLKSFPAPRGTMPGGRALHLRTLEVTPYAAGVREYVPGDSLNRIHWPTTARRDKLMVKEFEQDPQADIWVFVDAHAAVQAALPEPDPGSRGDRLWLWRHRPDEVTMPPATFEYSVSTAASIAHYFIEQGRAVGLASVGQIHVLLPAERGERQLGKILDTLAFIQAEGDLPLLGLVTAQAGHMLPGCTVVLITSSTDTGVLLAADDLEQRNLSPIVILIDSSTFGGVEGSGSVAASLQERGIQTKIVANGADLRIALEQNGVSGAAPNWWSQG